MGHNGAGKSTLINVLSGLLDITGGNAKIFDAQLTDNFDSMRKKLGIVSQFDVLWDELTAREHMYMFAELKRVRYSNFDSLLNKRLRDVGLLES